jgi:Kdo2-lipid IVA lauroyltransferase/acyltransferase
MNLTFLEYSTYYSLAIISFLINILSRYLSIKLGRMIGDFIRIFIPIRKKVAIQNLKIAFPNKSIIEINKIIKQCYRHFGIVFIDLFRFPTLNQKKLIHLVKIHKKDLELLRENKGGIIVTGHIGNWELFLPIFGFNNIPFLAVAQFQRNKGVQKFFKKLREKHKSKIILKGISSKELISIINNNEYLGLASDQNAGKKGIMVPFFGKETSVPKGAGIFHIKTKCPIFICYCIADSNYNYNFIVNKLNTSNFQDSTNDKLFEINKVISNDLEKYVTLYPEQYFWFHRKWPKKIYKTK